MKKTSKAKKPLTPHQRLAVQRRAADRACRESLKKLEDALTGGETALYYGIEPNYRAKTALALSVILHGGPLFAVACAKAYMARHWTAGTPESIRDVWAFIDEQNALFAERVGTTHPDVLARWNAADYELPTGRDV